MRDIRIFQPGSYAIGDSFVVEEAEARHLTKVLRRGVGESFLLLDGVGHEFEAHLVEVGKRDARAEIVGLARQAAAPRPRVLACALLKSPSFEETLERATELGMTAFHPIAADRSIAEVHADRAEKKIAKWQRACGEALKQCERLWLPRMGEPAPIEAYLERARAEGTVAIMLRERAPEVPPLSRRIAEAGGRGIVLLVGPEGGWSARELAAAEAAGALGASLGTEAILRAETAALAALAIAQGMEG